MKVFKTYKEFLDKTVEYIESRKWKIHTLRSWEKVIIENWKEIT